MKFNNLALFAVLGGLFMWSMQNKEDEIEMLKAEKAKVELEAKSKIIASDLKKEIPELVRVDSLKNSTDSTLDSSLIVKAVTPKTIVVDNGLFKIKIDNKGAFIKSLILNSLADSKGVLPELIQDTTMGMLGFNLEGLKLDNELFYLDSNLSNQILIKDSLNLKLVWSGLNGQKVFKSFGFKLNDPAINVKIWIENIQTQDYTLDWKGGLTETENEKIKSGGMMGADYFFSELAIYNGEELEKETSTEVKTYNEEFGNVQWAGMRRKYVAGIFDFGDKGSEAKFVYAPLDMPKEFNNEHVKGSYSLTIQDKLEAGGKLDFKFKLLTLNYEKIKSYNRGYETLVVSGFSWFLGADVWFPILSGFILQMLNYFYTMVPNYGVAIIILTLIVRFGTFPLTIGQIKSTRKMKEHKPGMDAIRKKYSKDPQRMQQELFAYYKKVGFNPLAPMLGCMPMLLQMPVFMALYVVLGRAVELRNMPFGAWITDLASPDVITEIVKIPFIMPDGIVILPIIMAATTYFQTKQTMTDPNMKMMIYIMPAMMLFFAGIMPSGLVLYWTVSNLFTIGQYMIIGGGNTPVVAIKK
jgi:YidC/Oxa1 family membrane protein insertase